MDPLTLALVLAFVASGSSSSSSTTGPLSFRLWATGGSPGWIVYNGGTWAYSGSFIQGTADSPRAAMLAWFDAAKLLPGVSVELSSFVGDPESFDDFPRPTHSAKVEQWLKPNAFPPVVWKSNRSDNTVAEFQTRAEAVNATITWLLRKVGR